MFEELIPMVVCTGMFAMIFGIAYLRNRENMALIERGMNPRTKDTRPRPFLNLKWGLLLIGSGAGLLLAYIIDSVLLGAHVVITHASIHSSDSDSPAIYFALIGIGGGLGLFYSYKIEKKEWLDKKREE